MNYENNDNIQTPYDRIKIGSKKLGSYALAIALIPYFNIFGFPLKHIGLLILFCIMLTLQILSVIRFIKYNHMLSKNIKIELLEDLFLMIGCLISIVLSFVFVSHEYLDDKLERINYNHAEFWVIDFGLMLVAGFILAFKTKKIH